MSEFIFTIHSILGTAKAIDTNAEILSEQESEGDYPSSSQWQEIDDARANLADEAVTALRKMLPLLRAVEQMSTVLGDGMTADHTGGSFTCTEANILAEVLVTAGYTGEATTWIEGHGAGDDDVEDEHSDIHDAFTVGEFHNEVTGALATEHVKAMALSIGLTA